jgi:hypothetical protein
LAFMTGQENCTSLGALPEDDLLVRGRGFAPCES